MTGAVVSGARATRLIARMAVVRLLRGKTWWITAPLGVVLPVLLLLTNRSELPGLWREFVEAVMIPVLFVPPIHLASALTEEMDDRTITYLWSRPVPRWSVITGKLLALVPIIALGLAAVTGWGFVQAYADAASAHVNVLAWGVAGVVLGVIAASCLSVSIGCLIPKQATAVVIVYVLAVDLPLSALGFAVENLSILHQALAVARGVDDGAAAVRGVVWLLGLSAVWLTVAMWRVSRRQFSAQD